MGTNTLTPTTECGVKPSSLTPTGAKEPIPTGIGTLPGERRESRGTRAQTFIQDPIRGPNRRPGNTCSDIYPGPNRGP